MPKFDTKVQELKNRILKEVAVYLFNDENEGNILDIPKTIIPGPKPSMRCCIYKERAIVGERVKLILNPLQVEENTIKVIPIACDECPLGGYTVSDACRGCIAHRCSEACPKKCISFNENLKASIDKTKCINCGLCAKSCPYEAIENRVRPCEKACKQKCISPNQETGAAQINDEKCIACGQCVYMCPFGAIVDTSSIKKVIKFLNNKEEKTFAVVAPSISTNFYPHSTGKVVSGIEKLGFFKVIEAALGADLVALEEAKELEEKGLLTSSCCPAFVSYVRKYFPEVADKVSTTLSPMAMISKVIKQKFPDSNVVFIGPCTAKKEEIKLDTVKDYVDAVITFEELQALFEAKEIDLATLEEGTMEGGSAFGRGFAKCGGLTAAVNQALKERGSDFVAKGIVCDGIDNIRSIMLKVKQGKSEYNFIEGMACVGGCIGGPCNLTHEPKDKIMVDKFAQGGTKTISDAINDAEDLID